MARKVLISLVSEQTIPNVELIKEFKDIDLHYFIYTKQMQKQLEWILRSTDIKSYEVIEVDPYDPIDIKNKIEAIDFGDAHITLNSTGGTKLMSLVATNVLKEMGAVIYYVTGRNKEYLKIYPTRGKSKFKLQEKLNLAEYLTAYGFSYKPSKPYKNFEQAEKIFKFFVNSDINEWRAIMEKIRLFRGKKMKINDKKLKIFLQLINYDFSNNQLNKHDTKYLSGEWLEDFVYFKLKSDFNLSDDEIAKGVQIEKDGVKNELDVVFIYYNKLFLIECKTSITEYRLIKRVVNSEEKIDLKAKNLLPEIIYKADALRTKFGLFAKTYILTLEELKNSDGTPLNNANKAHFERASLSKINIISKRDLQQIKDFKELLKIKI